MQVDNNERNLQIPIDDLAQGFDCKVTWTASEPALAAAFQPEAPFVPGFEATPSVPPGMAQVIPHTKPFRRSC